MLVTVLLMSLAMLIVVIDDLLSKEESVLGEEWDFTRPSCRNL